MKTIAKLAVCLFFAGTVTIAFAQQSTTAKKANNKQKSTKQKKEIDNKIAASDEAQTADKGAKKSTTKSSGISNK
jgi:hypothetical protein